MMSTTTTHRYLEPRARMRGRCRSRLLLLATCLLASVAISGAWSQPVEAASPESSTSSWMAGSWALEPIGGTDAVSSYQLDSGRLVWIRPSQSGGSDVVLFDLESRQQTPFFTPAAPMDGQDHLAFQGDRVAFIGWDGQASQVYLLSLATGDVTQMTSLDANESAATPFLRGDFLIWQEREMRDSTRWQLSRIMSQNLRSGETRVLADRTTYSELLSPSWPFLVSDRWLVFWNGGWLDREAVYAVSLETGETRSCPDVGFPWDMEVYGDELYYAPYDSEKWQHRPELHRLDLRTGEDQVVVSGMEFQSVRANDRYLVWATWESGQAHIVVRDRSSGEDTHIPVVGYGGVGWLRLSGDLLLWVGQSTFPSSFFGGGQYYLFVYDVSAGQVTRLGPSLHPVDYYYYTDGQSVAFSEFQRLTSSSRAILATTATPTPPVFADVSGFDPYFTAITGMRTLGAAQGYERADALAEYRPLNLVTRAQFAKMLARALRIEIEAGSAAPFVDLGPDDPDNLFPHQYVGELARLGIIQGTSSGHFDPYANLTRRQLLTLVVRAADRLYPGALTGSVDLGDDPTSIRAAANGLLDGVVGAANWNPWREATRAEAAQVLWNLVETVQQSAGKELVLGCQPSPHWMAQRLWSRRPSQAVRASAVTPCAHSVRSQF